jgi:alpha-aminoadipate carrier protein LysW
MTMTPASATTATCPECDAAVAPPADPVQGEILACPSCGAELEVIGITPFAVAVAPELSEDWGE